MYEKISIYKTAYDNVTLSEAATLARELMEEEKNHIVVTPNAEIAYLAANDDRLGQTINAADIVVADGVGVVLASKIYGTPVKQKVAGVELGEEVLKFASDEKIPVFFLGAKPGVAELAAARMSEKYINLNFVGLRDGYFEDSEEVVDEINRSGAKILFVCLGAPKQELWAAKYQESLENVRLTLCLGGALDSYAGTVKRAPEIWIKLGLEWLYRLIKEPRRFKRMLALPKYMFAVIFDSMRKR